VITCPDAVTSAGKEAVHSAASGRTPSSNPRFLVYRASRRPAQDGASVASCTRSTVAFVAFVADSGRQGGRGGGGGTSS
jgi:hypothetical protein